MDKRLETAFSLTHEDHSDAFERFANAFLIEDYPELQAVGGKKDKGMDARIIPSDSEHPTLVLQSCVSPASKARTKILQTIAKFDRKHLPRTFVYCTPAKIGLALDATRQELRNEHGVFLDVCDGEWLSQRTSMSDHREKLAAAFADSVLVPLLPTVQPKRLYTEVLSSDEERVAIQYLEAHILERAQHQNLTKLIFDSLIIFATRDTESPNTLLGTTEIIAAIRQMFPPEHAPRIQEIVPGRIEHLVRMDVLKEHRKLNGFALSHHHKLQFRISLAKTSERELVFRAILQNAIAATASRLEIDYEYDLRALSNVGHACLLWFLHEQSKQLKDATGALLNIFNAEELVRSYLAARKDIDAATINNNSLTDILPEALYTVLSSDDKEVRSYLRDKADLFIMEAFLQASPDVQKACKKLFGSDVLYVDTTILIRALSEKFTDGEEGAFLQTLRQAKSLGVRFHTFHIYVEELVSHLRGPVLLDWQNHGFTMGPSNLQAYLRTAPTLIGVFNEYQKHHSMSMDDIVTSIIGTSNEVDNAIEYLREEFGITTEPMPVRSGAEMQVHWEEVFGVWLSAKRKWPSMKPERFEVLVRNDVNAFTAMLQMRKETNRAGGNYGHKIWVLTLDRMFWRVPVLLGKNKDDLYRVAMGIDYLINFVATLSNITSASSPVMALPVTLFTDVSLPSELREAVTKEYVKEGQKKYLIERRVRELVHELKASSAQDNLGTGGVDFGQVPDDQV